MITRVINYLKREIQPFNWLFSLFMYFIFSLIYTFPLVLYLNKYVIGDLEGDMWKHLWGFWWVKRRIFDEGVLPLFTSLLNYPYGGNLFFIDPLGAILSIPLQAFLQIHVVYNVLVIFNIVFGAFCAYILANYFVKNKAAAFYSGAVYGFTAYLLAYITSGVSETFNIGWIPLFIYFYARTLREESELYPILAGVTLFVTSLGAFYYGNFATIVGVFFFAFFAYYQYRKKIPVKKGLKKPSLSIIQRMEVFQKRQEVAPAIASASQQYRETFRAETIGRMGPFGLLSTFFPSKVKGRQRVMGFRESLLRTGGHLALTLLLANILAFIFILPGYLSNLEKSSQFWTLFTIQIIIFVALLVFILQVNRAKIRSFIFHLYGLFYSDKPKHVNVKMSLIFSLYTLSIAGFFQFFSLGKHIEWAAFYSTLFLSSAAFIIAAIMTYMEVMGENLFIKVKSSAREKTTKTLPIKTSPKNMIEYAKVFIPLMILTLSFLNILRVILYYQEIYSAYGLANIMGNLAASVIVFLGILLHIISSKLYLKWGLFRSLYIEPELPEDRRTPENQRRVVRNNILITFFLLLSVSVPPVALYAKGFPPDLYIKYWILFTFGIATLGALIFFLSKKPSSDLASSSEQAQGFRAFLDSMVRGPMRRLLMMSIVALALIVPLFITFRASLSGAAGLVQRERSLEFIDLYLSKRFHNVSRLADYVTMGKQNVVRTYTVDRLTRSSYAGWITIVIAFSSLFLAKKRKYFWFWAFCAAFFIVFSLGPYLYVNDDIHLSWRFPLYILFYKYFPFFSQISIPYRFNIIAMLSLAMLAGYALASIFKTWEKSHQWTAAGCLSLAMLFEVCILSPAPYPIPLSDLRVPTFYQEIAQDTDEYGIIDSPIQRVKGELLPGEYFYYQMTHKKGIPYKVEGTIPVYIYENQFTVYLFNLEKGYSVSPPDEKLLRQYLDALKKNQFKYIVVHNEYLRKSARTRVHTYLEHFLGKPKIYQDGNLYVYKIY